MGMIYITPEVQNPERSVRLMKDYGGLFEYGDFFDPKVLDDRYKQEEIIESYAKYRTDFSQDTMHGAFFDVTIHSVDPLIREASEKRVWQSMEIAKRMGLRGVVFHTGLLAGCRLDSYLENWKKENVRFFTKLAEKYPNQEILMENMFDEESEYLAELGEEMREVPNFGICLDYAHAVLSGCPTEKWVQELAPFIRHMHLNDNDLKKDLHLAVGTGKIDWTVFQSQMLQAHVDCTVLLEVRGYEAQKKSLEYLEEHKFFPMHTQVV